jgi:hypothetical protein
MGITVGQHVAIQLNGYTTRFGTVKRIGRTMVHVVPNGGGDAEAYPEKMIYPSGQYMARNPNPYERTQNA